MERPLFTAGVLAVLVGVTPDAASTRLNDPPVPNLKKIRLENGTATAPLFRGGRATLTINPKLQRTAARLLARARPVSGAIVVADAKSGHILAMKGYRRDGSKTSVSTQHAPSASLFKLVTTAALLEKTPVVPQTKVCVSGGQRRIQLRHLTAPPRGQGRCAAFSRAIGFSRNAVFAQLATQHLKPEVLLEAAERFGFNRSLPFDVPAPMGRIRVPQNNLDFARTAAGFGKSSLSPLGATHLAFAIANGGTPARLRIVKESKGYAVNKHQDLLQQAIKRRTARRLTRMMEVTVHSGTSLDAFTNRYGASYLGGIRVAGKTGTLQPHKTAPTASWFVGFAPSRNPEVVISVLLQNGPVWRRKANEVARDVLRAQFSKRRGVSDPFREAG
ncbi:MAG: penicillin-binding protein [Polyangiaceae bacterium]|nr:penicillin-binding protein [Polyangiaceae bacterium]